jgi:hypothetical protein
MSTRPFLSTVGRLVLAATGLIASAGCGGEMLRTGRAPVILVIENMTATAGGSGSLSAFLLSDVEVIVEQTVGGQTVQVATIFNDSATATIGVMAKNQAEPTSPLNTVTLTRYRVNFRRTDGRNTPGVDVPYGFDGGLGISIPAGGSADVAFEIVRHQAKLEPPLANLVRGGGQVFISTFAEVTFYGHDQNGNEVSVVGRIDVQFGDFGDE